ncbi:MAG: hypothetical protein JNM64_11600 [Chloroflexia bacterium]|nr:hypothetical protein [Chloroflexia bacterium]
MKRVTQAVLAGAAIVALMGTSTASARDTWIDIAAAGNGGIAGANADGGAVTVGDVNSGGNAGNSIAVGNTTYGGVYVRGGTATNRAAIGVSTDGGTAIADAAGGDDNLAAVN